MAPWLCEKEQFIFTMAHSDAIDQKLLVRRAATFGCCHLSIVGGDVILSWERRRNTDNLWSNSDGTFGDGLKTDQFGRCTTLIWTVECQQ